MRPKPNKAAPPAQDCPLEDCLRFLAGAWTPKILWYLREEPRRFGDLKRDLGSVSAKVLTTRLRELESRGVIERKVQSTSPPTVEYSLTALGQKFQPVLDSIVVVGLELKKSDGALSKKRRGEADVPSVSPLARVRVRSPQSGEPAVHDRVQGSVRG